MRFSMGAWRSISLVIMTVVASLVLIGCASTPTGEGGPRVVIERGPAPSYAEVAAVVNARAAALKKIYAFATLHVWYLDEDGKEEEEQFEVRIMLDQPNRAFMRFQLATVELAVLGCDEREYWWINLRDERRAWLGTHDRTTPQLVAYFVIPIHPLNFVELMGMTAIPAQQGEATVAWSDDGRNLVVETASRFGRRRTILSPFEGGYDPARIELLDESGVVTVSADLSKYEWQRLSRGEPMQRVAKEIHFDLAANEARARLRPQYDGPHMVKSRAFDRERLFKAYKIKPEDVELLDEMAGRDG
jgi:outer membrane lipoprotein-sorting protein